MGTKQLLLQCAHDWTEEGSNDGIYSGHWQGLHTNLLCHESQKFLTILRSHAPGTWFQVVLRDENRSCRLQGLPHVLINLVVSVMLANDSMSISHAGGVDPIPSWESQMAM